MDRASRCRLDATNRESRSRTLPRSRPWERRRRAVSPEIGTLDRASLEAFQTDLIRIGFEPLDVDRRRWQGPIAASFAGLTEASTMTIVFKDGWPFQHPRLIVDGIDKRHVSTDGDICLWRSGAAASAQWITVDGYYARIDEWTERARAGFTLEDFALDAHLSFGRVRVGAIATVELGALDLDRASHGNHAALSGTWHDDEKVLKIERGNAGRIPGHWYYAGAVDSPPRDLEGVRSVLAANQQKNFDRRYKNVAGGEQRLFLIVWDREFGREALVLLATNTEGEVASEAIEVAPTDTAVLQLRTGPDVDLLQTKTAVIFGVGAVGSNVACRLAECGFRKLVLVDGGRLRPGDVVRHGGDAWIGWRKTAAVWAACRRNAPWTEVVMEDFESWHPQVLRNLIHETDIVIDGTGESAFATLLSLVCAGAKPLVSAALYRNGSVGRVRRQAASADVEISARSADLSYPVIPPDENDELRFEPGCSNAVNNSSPNAVASIAALTADVVIDTLSERFLHGDEVIDVYRPLEDEPFDRIGRRERGSDS